jgi:hypothetical protein
MVCMSAATAEKATVPMSEVRAWAIKRGMPVNKTGNLPSSVVEAFNRAHRTKQFLRSAAGQRIVERR